MQTLHLFLPCAAGVESYLAQEVQSICGITTDDLRVLRAGVMVRGNWRFVLLLNLHSRLAQRVLVEVAYAPYRQEQDLYAIASSVAWEQWFTPKQSFKIEITAQHSPLKSLNFAALKIKDAVADRFREQTGVRPNVETRWPDARIYAHLTHEQLTLYIDTSGEPLFKRGWRTDKGDAPLKETLAAAMLAASGWSQGDGSADNPNGWCDQGVPVYDPCCGSGTIAIEAAMIGRNRAPGISRNFLCEQWPQLTREHWKQSREEARDKALGKPKFPLQASDIDDRVVRLAQSNAIQAGIGGDIEFKTMDVLELKTSLQYGVVITNPPYGERLGDDESAAEIYDDMADAFEPLATWSIYVLTSHPGFERLFKRRAQRRRKLYNGRIECQYFQFLGPRPPWEIPVLDGDHPADKDNPSASDRFDESNDD